MLRKTVLPRRFAVAAVGVVLTALLLGSCDSGGSDVTWTIHTRAKSPTGSEYVEQDFTWDPINNEIVGTDSQFASASGKKEVREAGFSTQPNGYLLSEETTLSYKKDKVEQQMTFRFDGDFSGTPEGEFTARTRINGEPQDLASGEFFVTTGLDEESGTREFLRNNSHAFLYAEAEKDIAQGNIADARTKLDTIIELKPEHIAAWRKKTGLHLATGEPDAAKKAVEAALETDSGNLAALEQKHQLLMMQGDYEKAYSVRQELFEKQKKRDEDADIVVPSYASKKTDEYYLEEYYVLDAYLDLVDAALLSGDYESAEENLKLAEKEINDNLSTYNTIYNPKQRSFSVPFYRKLDVYSLVQRLDVYQILYTHRDVVEQEADTSSRDEFFRYLDGLVIRDFASGMGVRPREVDESSWLPNQIFKDQMDPNSGWQIGNMVRRPKEFLLELGSGGQSGIVKRHPESLAAIASCLPLFARSDDAGWDFAEEWQRAIRSRINALDARFFLLVKKYTGYDEPEKAEEFDRKIQRGDVDFVTAEVIEPEHFIREYEYDDTLDITMPGSEFVSMNVNYMLALAYLGDLEGAQSFGFAQYYTMSPIHTTVFRILATENLQWPEVREDLDYLIDEGRGRYTQYFLSYFLRDPEYRNRRDELSRAFGYVQMQL